MVNHKSYLSGLVQVMALACISMAAIQCSKVDEPAPPQTAARSNSTPAEAGSVLPLQTTAAAQR